MTNVLSYGGINAKVKFDAEKMQLVGKILADDKQVTFHAQTVLALETEYERAVAIVRNRKTALHEISQQLVSIPEVLQSGEAKIFIHLNESNDHIGCVVREILEMADGAGITIQEDIIE